MSFSAQLKTAMMEREITVSELAKLVGTGKPSISQYLSGKNIPKVEKQERIAEVLGCTVEYLNGEAEEEPIGLYRLTPAQAAKRLGVNPQAVRVALQQGTAPYGYAWKAGSKWAFHISPKKLDEYIGAQDTIS